MVRNLIAGLGTLGLFFMLAGCSEDKDCPVGDASVDFLIDAPGEPQEAGPDITVDDAEPPDGAPEEDGPVVEDCDAKSLAGTITISQLISDVPGDTRFLFSFGPTFQDANNPLEAPDYINPAAPPNCTAYAWSAGEDKATHTDDAGDVIITGHETPQYDDGSGTLQDLPATITCKRTKAPNSARYWYDCGLGSVPMLESEAIVDGSKIDFSNTGGPCIPALSHKGADALTPGVETKPDPSFDLNNVDPGAGITAKWQTPAPSITAISISIQNKDETEFATLTCSGLGIMKTKVFPQEVLDFSPKPTAGNPIEVRTSLIGFDPSGKTDSWGKYQVGVGRGHFGVTCVSTTGATPGPCP